MAKRGKYNRRRNRGRLSFLYKLLSFFAICAVIGVALALFFKIQHREVSGNLRYTGQEILDASGVFEGDNMFLLNKYEVSARITSTLPYVETVQIRRALPDTLIFRVSECTAPAAVMQDGVAWLLSGRGKLVEKTTAGKAADYAQITGIHLTDPVLGQRAAASEAQSGTLKILLTLLEQLENKNMIDKVREIHLEDASQITLQYMDRFQVIIPWNADLDYKLSYLQAVVEKLEINETGTIDMTQDGRASFIPG